MSRHDAFPISRFYRVPVDQLLPGEDGPDFGPRPADTDIVIDLTDGAAATRSDDRPVKIKIDLTAIERLNGTESDMLTRYLRMIQVQRGDFNGRVLTVRRDDLRAIACILDVAPRSEEHTSELQSLMRLSYAVFC